MKQNMSHYLNVPNRRREIIKSIIISCILIPDTGSVAVAISAVDTLWSAAGRGAKVPLLALTHRLVLFHPAL